MAFRIGFFRLGFGLVLGWLRFGFSGGFRVALGWEQRSHQGKNTKTKDKKQKGAKSQNSVLLRVFVMMLRMQKAKAKKSHENQKSWEKKS